MDARNYKVKMGYSIQRGGWVAQSISTGWYLGSDGEFSAETASDAKSFITNSACTEAIHSTGVRYDEIDRYNYLTW